MSRLTRLLSLLTNYYVLRRSPTIVFSMRRSGSVALFNAVNSNGVFAIATHNLRPNLPPDIPISGSARWATDMIIRRRKPAKFISLVRNPFDTMASVFARSSFDAALASGQANEYPHEELSPEELGRQFVDGYLSNRSYQEQLTWFEAEYQPALGIDVYSHVFDKQRGFVRIDQAPHSALILKTELDDASKSKLVGDFLGLPDFQMGPPGKGAYSTHKAGLAPGMPGGQAPYSASYERLKRGLKIPEAYWEEIVNSRYARHFFTREELEASRSKLVVTPTK